MNISEIMERIHEIEKTIPVQEWRYKGIDIWPVLRSKLYFDLFLKYNFPAAEKKGGLFVRFYKLAKETIVSMPAFIKLAFLILSSKKVDAIFLADPSYTNWDGKRYHRFIDPEIEDLSQEGLSSITMVTTPASNERLTSPTMNIFILSLITKIIAATYIKFKKDKVQFHGFGTFIDYIARLGLPKITEEDLGIICSRYWMASRLYQNLLKALSPQGAFVVSYYEDFNMAFVHACKTLSIPVVDIQHGAINNYHACYGGWTNIPENGYSTLPDYFSCWDRYSASCINGWAAHTHGKHQSVVHGNRFMKKVVGQRSDFYKKFEVIQNVKRPRFNILLTLQTFYELTPFLVEILKSSPPNYFWWVRFHPMLDKQKINEIKESLLGFSGLQYETDQANSYSLYEILPHMDSHVTLNSSVVIEAAQMGIPSIVCEETGYNYYRAEFETGDAFQANTPQHVIELISSSQKKAEKLCFPRADVLYRMMGLNIPNIKQVQ